MTQDYVERRGTAFVSREGGTGPHFCPRRPASGLAVPVGLDPLDLGQGARAHAQLRSARALPYKHEKRCNFEFLSHCKPPVQFQCVGNVMATYSLFNFKYFFFF